MSAATLATLGQCTRNKPVIDFFNNHNMKFLLADIIIVLAGVILGALSATGVLPWGQIGTIACFATAGGFIALYAVRIVQQTFT